jgi:hypothetical protein
MSWLAKATKKKNLTAQLSCENFEKWSQEKANE